MMMMIIITIITCRTVPNSRHKRSTLSCSNSQQSQNFHSSDTEDLQKCTDLKAEHISMWQLNAVYTLPLCGIHKRYYPK
jgi:hypothetical protein